MANASPDFKRLLLRGIAWDAEDRALPLRDALRMACRARLNEVGAGQQVLQVQGNGQSIQFALPQEASELSAAAVMLCVSQLYDLLEESTAELTADSVALTDSALLARMLALLAVPANSSSSDYSRMSRISCA